MDCLCQWLRSATGKSYKTAITARYHPAERPSLRTGILYSFLYSSVRLYPGKQLLNLKTRIPRRVQVGLGVGIYFFGHSSFSVTKFLLCWQMEIIPENGQDTLSTWWIFFSFPTLKALQELKQHFLADVKGRGTSLEGRMQCHHRSPRNSQPLPKHGNPLAPLLWSAAFTAGHRLGSSYNFNEKSSEKLLVTVGEKQERRS